MLARLLNLRFAGNLKSGVGTHRYLCPLQFKKGVGVPGLDFVEDGPSKAKGKSAARNERRKQKKEVRGECNVT